MKVDKLTRLLLFIIFLFSCHYVIADTDQNFKSWNLLTVRGPLTANHKVNYYLQPQINFVDDKYKLNTMFMFIGIGYQAFNNAAFWLMNGYIYVQRPDGKLVHVDIIREQLELSLINNSLCRVSSTTRLEERKNTDESELAVVVREKLTVSLPFKNWENHSLLLFDEIFFNINHPAWIRSNSFMQQNRVFLGISTQLNKSAALDTGYLIQYQVRHKDVYSNVLYLALNLKF